MCSLEELKIDLKDLSEGVSTFRFNLGDAWFESLEEGEIKQGNVSVSIDVDRTDDYFNLDFHVEGFVTVPCDRCLDDCTEAQEHAFSEVFQQGGASGDDDVTSFTGDTIELDALVRDTLLVAQPLSNICKPDCKGLCPVCGANLNHGDCGCDRFVPDPRLAALQGLFTQKD